MLLCPQGTQRHRSIVNPGCDGVRVLLAVIRPEQPITATLVESIMSRQLDDLKPTLTRNGYRLKDMVE